MKNIDPKQVELFLNVKTRASLAKSLGVEFKNLSYNLYKLKQSDKYTIFEIPKRKGGSRKIIAPNLSMKRIQRNLADLLLEIYPDKSCCHGYSKKKGVLTNAKVHSGRRIVINLDLKDFFPSINSGRIIGLFQAYPFNFNRTVATTLAHICCYDDYLPQGAPSSPILSNYICRRLDNQLLDLIRQTKCSYSRYADDITISTNLKEIPVEIGRIIDNRFEPSHKLKMIIKQNGFKINTDKIRFALRNNRQEVTGLVVNQFPNLKRSYIRQIRAMLHAWEKFGIKDAAKDHFAKYNYKEKLAWLPELSFQAELVGKIGYVGHIRGKDDVLYAKLYSRIKKLNPEVKLSILDQMEAQSIYPIIYCEGKTDVIHLKNALDYFKKRGEFVGLHLKFADYSDGLTMNNSELMKICEGWRHSKFHNVKIICLFDRDDKWINGRAITKSGNFKYWGNKVYSSLLPIPSHRDFNEICIEHYYTDEELQTSYHNGRRLYLSSEFDKSTGRHKKEDISYVNLGFLQAQYPRIIDNNVFKTNGVNIALSKSGFAQGIQDGNFKTISFDHFRIIFEHMKEIVEHTPN